MKQQEPHILQTVFHFFTFGEYWIRDSLEVTCPSLACSSCLGTVVCDQSSSAPSLNRKQWIFVMRTSKFPFPIDYCLCIWYLWRSKGCFQIIPSHERKHYILHPTFHKAYLSAVSKLILLFSYCFSIPVTPISPQIDVNAKPSFFSNTLSLWSICDTTHYECSVKSVSE